MAKKTKVVTQFNLGDEVEILPPIDASKKGQFQTGKIYTIHSYSSHQLPATLKGRGLLDPIKGSIRLVDFSPSEIAFSVSDLYHYIA